MGDHDPTLCRRIAKTVTRECRVQSGFFTGTAAGSVRGRVKQQPGTSVTGFRGGFVQETKAGMKRIAMTGFFGHGFSRMKYGFFTTARKCLVPVPGTGK